MTRTLASVLLLASILYPSISHGRESFDSLLAYQNENDSSRIGGPGTDKSYTNGFRWTYAFRSEPHPFLRQIAEIEEDTNTSYHIGFSQKIFTPEDTFNSAPVEDDQPYAAWLYFSLGANFQSSNWMQSWDFSLGTIGPNALGKTVQNSFHYLSGDPETRGWSNQLRDEPTFQLNYQLRHRVVLAGSPDRYYSDLIPYFGAGLGNVLIGLQTGGFFRLGYQMGEDLGPTRLSTFGGDAYPISKLIPTNSNFGIYAFAGVSAAAIGRNIFLDGNTFADSQSVDKLPFVYSWERGLAFRAYRLHTSWRYISLSPEFRQRRRSQDLVSLQFIYLWGG
ncbi:MAG: lipid A deacylase LpxR family protein [Bdellovibrionales bacterium]